VDTHTHTHTHILLCVVKQRAPQHSYTLMLIYDSRCENNDGECSHNQEVTVCVCVCERESVCVRESGYGSNTLIGFIMY